MTKGHKVLLLSIVAMMLAVSLVVMGTFALFTAEKEFNTHLQAGTLSISLQRTSLTYTKLGKDGDLVCGTDGSKVDFSKTDQNIFGLADGELVVPGCVYQADLQVVNQGNIAFGYWVELRMSDGNVGNALAQQLKLTVTPKDGKVVTATVAEGLIAGGQNEPLSTVVIGGTGDFTVKVEFINHLHNNDAQAQEISFDLTVHAIQATGN